MKIVSIIGARPQFIKSAPVSMVIADAGYIEYKIHTGQHYDYSMSQIFFDELGIAEPTINLGIGSGTHGRQTGEMLIGIEKELLEQNPDIVIVYGDTNSTLAGSLAACKLNIKLAHVEAGLRSRNRLMPEEHNRVLTDHCSDLLFCPTQTAVNNLSNEGIKKGVHLVGDTMYDAVLLYMKLAEQKSKILQTLGITSKDYLLATIHRAYTTDNPGLLKGIISAFRNSNELIIFPMHPRTGQTFKKFSISIPENVRVIDPVGYLDMIMLEINARLILTDSGGMQKEAYFFSVPCLTLRTETEWTETVESGWNKLVGFDSRTIIDGINSLNWPDQLSVPIYGDGNASKKIIKLL